MEIARGNATALTRTGHEAENTRGWDNCARAAEVAEACRDDLRELEQEELARSAGDVQSDELFVFLFVCLFTDTGSRRSVALLRKEPALQRTSVYKIRWYKIRATLPLGI